MLPSMVLPVASTNPATDGVQVKLLRGAGTAGPAARALALSRTVIAPSRRAIPHRHPDWPERDVLLEFAAVHYGGDLARRVRPHLERRAR
jgi:hypothetical protein